jgi:HD-like signal output (HDOD) protein
MKRVLFVDDEPQMLSGLQRLLRPQRHEWEMKFAEGGEQALVALDETPYDVIVTDMRMPGMDGVTLLEQVKDQWPQMVRIILSGYTELEATLRTVPVAHQFLTKPCDPDRLKDVVERACALQSLLNREALRATIAQMGDLPSQPGVYLALAEALADPATSMADVAQLIEQDIAMSAKCLQLVNSAFFGLGRRVARIQEAVHYLGLETLRALVLHAGAFEAFAPTRPIDGFEISALQRRSHLAARIARRLAPDARARDDAFTAGMLHGIGLLVLARQDPYEFGAAIAEAQRAGAALHEVEYAHHGSSHAELGAYVLGIWGLPEPIVDGVAHQHRIARLAGPALDTPLAVHVATVLAAERCPEAVATPAGALDAATLAAAGAADRVVGWRALAAGESALA